jgi:N-acyl-D-amino-acid deacylase
LILDGLGTPATFGELAVRGNRIAALGPGLGPGRSEIDAKGLALAPGIVDIHTHYDAQLTWDPFARPSPALGVTTVCIGNCGFTIAPCRPADRDLTIRNLTHVEGMPLAALRAGINWDFHSFPEYLDSLVRNGVVPNVAAFVGHSSVRTYVLGSDAAKRPAAKPEIAAMRDLVLDALRAGALEFATSTLEQHNGENGIPMPSRLADEAEMRALTGALGEAGRGVFEITKGSKTTIPWLESIAAANGRPVMICALLLDQAFPERVFDELDQIAAAQARGRELYGQVGCFPLTMDFGLRHPYPFESLLAWRPAMAAADDAALKRVYADPSFRQALKDEVKTPGPPGRFTDQWDHLEIMRAGTVSGRAFEGKPLRELARAQGQHPFDFLLDFGLQEDLETQFTARLLNADEEKVGRLLQHPYSAIALSDAGAHLSFLCDAGFGLHLLGHWVRERGVFTLEQAVQALTSRPADMYRIAGRGRLQAGAFADLMLFDPATVARGPKRRVADLPAGADRLDTAAVGLTGVWVNGARIVEEHGRIENCGRPGIVLRDFGP